MSTDMPTNILCRGKDGCGVEKPPSDFGNKKSGKWGKNSLCLECDRKRNNKRYAEDEAYKEAQKIRSSNQVPRPEYQAKYFQEHKKEQAEYKCIKRATDPAYRAKESAASRKRYASLTPKQKVEVRLGKKATRAKNRPLYNGHSRDRRMAVKGARVEGSVSPTIELLILRDGSNCMNCDVPLDISPYEYGKVKVPFNSSQVEHLIPLTRGGKDIMENTQAWCLRCNKEKLDRTIFEYRLGISLDINKMRHCDAGLWHPLAILDV